MAVHRLASLKHRQDQFERKIGLELKNRKPDAEALDFFETQKARIASLIEEIEAKPAPRAPIQGLRTRFSDDVVIQRAAHV